MERITDTDIVERMAKEELTRNNISRIIKDLTCLEKEKDFFEFEIINDKILKATSQSLGRFLFIKNKKKIHLSIDSRGAKDDINSKNGKYLSKTFNYVPYKNIINYGKDESDGHMIVGWDFGKTDGNGDL